jgi:hypothetical protein
VRGREVLDHPKSEALANSKNAIQTFIKSKELLELWQGFFLRMYTALRCAGWNHMEIIMQSFMTGGSPMRRQSCAIALAAAAAAFAFTSPAHADFIAGCTGGGSSLTCTFTAINGEVFVDSQAADINLSANSTVNIAASSETFTFNNVTSTNSTLQSPGGNVDGLGTFTVVDNLNTSPPRANTITITLSGTNLATAPNLSGNTFGAHLCDTVTDPNCAATFFSAPVPGPILGAGLPGLMMACTGLIVLARRRRKLVV